MKFANVGEYNFLAGCRAASASKLLDGEATELYVYWEDSGLSAGAIAGIVIGCVAVIGGVCGGIFVWLKKKAQVHGAFDDP